MKHPAPVFLFVTDFSASFLRAVGPEMAGGKGTYLRESFTADLEYRGPPDCENNILGKLIKLPGMPNIYDWELYPQAKAAQDHWQMEALLAKYVAYLGNLL